MLTRPLTQLRELLLGPATITLPPRVQDSIRRQQDRGERLTGWIQLGVVLLFTLLWALSPPVNAMLRGDLAGWPVPVALAVYGALTVNRLVWSHRGRLPEWSLAISVVFDMALLLVVIWSFHLTYHQPPSFYLKAPTVLYIFIFIALRALRFDGRFVLLAGGVAAGGWALMVLYVLLAEPGNPMITSDYVTYLTSNALLLGAEFDKIISILVFAVILAIAIGRTKALLLRAASDRVAARELSRFFDAGVAARIAGAAQAIEAGQGEFRQAAILSLDLRGFTRLTAEHPPCAMLALLSEYQGRLVPLIQRHGGAVDKFLGDGILASFGAVRPSARPAAAALEALEAVMAAAAVWQAERAAGGRASPRVNGAMAAGQVLFGAVGDASRLEYTVLGDPVNLAAKLEKQNKALGTAALADGASYDLALTQGYRPSGRHHRLPDQPVEGLTQFRELVIVSS